MNLTFIRKVQDCLKIRSNWPLNWTEPFSNKISCNQKLNSTHQTCAISQDQTNHQTESNYTWDNTNKYYKWMCVCLLFVPNRSIPTEEKKTKHFNALIFHKNLQSLYAKAINHIYITWECFFFLFVFYKVFMRWEIDSLQNINDTVWYFNKKKFDSYIMIFFLLKMCKKSKKCFRRLHLKASTKNRAIIFLPIHGPKSKAEWKQNPKVFQVLFSQTEKYFYSSLKWSNLVHFSFFVIELIEM